MLAACSSRCVPARPPACCVGAVPWTHVSSVLVSQQKPAEGSWEDPSLEKLHGFCEESRRLNDWLPEVSLPAR